MEQKSSPFGELLKQFGATLITSSHHITNLNQVCCTVKIATPQFFHPNMPSLYQSQHVPLLYYIYAH